MPHCFDLPKNRDLPPRELPPDWCHLYHPFCVIRNSADQSLRKLGQSAQQQRRGPANSSVLFEHTCSVQCIHGTIVLRHQTWQRSSLHPISSWFHISNNRASLTIEPLVHLSGSCNPVPEDTTTKHYWTNSKIVRPWTRAPVQSSTADFIGPRNWKVYLCSMDCHRSLDCDIPNLCREKSLRPRHWPKL